ncbi:NblA/ycf18 family protein [Chamaesiphon sp. OTE_20_metabat_361]|uniref:NblA/ycf18 family protein n=1 Tax=Chamaesiphon sp. OTE_20_metabat_361 TaxID=2964689 RepID=UPI00286B1ABA|nr:NblA/ycf18 family protein [Chamaesiphon sp. OTE_20_metabat_361]
MSPECFELSLEQQFYVKTLELSTQNLSLDRMRKLLIELSKQLLVKDNVVRHLIKNF